MTTPTDRALAQAFVEVTDGGTNWNLYTGFDLVEAIERRAAEIDASKPNEPQGHQPPPDNIGPCPAHAEAVETLPGLWRKKAAETNDRAMKAWYLGFASELEAALAARPAAVGGVLPELPEWSKRDDLGGLVPSEIRAALKNYARAAIATTQPQQLAVTEEAVVVAYEYLRGKSWSVHSLRDAISLALPHLARKKTT